MVWNIKDKGILIIGIILLFIFLLSNQKEPIMKEAIKKQAESGVRTVSNTNPFFNEMVTVTLTITLEDTDGINNGYFGIEEPIPDWNYHKGNFNEDLNTNKLKKIGINKAAGTYEYSYTVTAPNTIDSLTFTGGSYATGEGAAHGADTPITGVSSITSQAPSCSIDIDCNDNNVCTTEVCSGSCQYTNLNIGSCNPSIGNDGICQDGGCVCADTCSSLGYECGSQTVCSGIADCGTCTGDDTCSNGICIPPLQTCSQQGGFPCQSGQNCQGGNFIDSADYGTLCCGGGTCTTPTQTCSGLGGSTCSSGQNCNGGTMTSTSDSSRCCVGGSCQTPTQTCSGLGGAVCASGLECSITTVSTSDTTKCCTGTCVAPEVGGACEERLGCEIYEGCNAAETGCEVASWVWIAGGFVAFMLVYRMLK